MVNRKALSEHRPHPGFDRGGHAMTRSTHRNPADYQ